ncbi:MAG TPA: hypothetical protein VNW49_00820 [Puia sp.]|nr:hypothetical protein [Puia sp.]
MNADDQKDIDKSEKELWPQDPNADITTQFSTPSPETEMEVHHHPQLDHKPKPWKEYLLEGFMIFIAVMLGFFAENIREDITNSEHVRQLTSQMVQDLKVDTNRLNNIIENEQKILRSNDTLFSLLQEPFEKLNTKKLQMVAINAHGMWPFHASLGAIAAIKNELHLKQFANSEIIRYIAQYEGNIELLHTVQDITLQYQRNFLDPFLSRHFTPANLNAAFHHASPDEKMRNLTQEDLTQLGAEMVLIRINNDELIRDNQELKQDAIELLQYVTRQYNLSGY